MAEDSKGRPEDPTQEEIDAAFNRSYESLTLQELKDELDFLDNQKAANERGRVNISRMRDLAFHSRNVKLSEDMKVEAKINLLAERWTRKQREKVVEEIRKRGESV